VGASQYVYGEERRKNLKITDSSFKRWEDAPEAVEQVEQIIKTIKAL
jgi:hypothetical protein